MSQAKIVDAFGRPIETLVVRTSLGFVPQQIPAETSEPPGGVAPPLSYSVYSLWRR